MRRPDNEPEEEEEEEEGPRCWLLALLTVAKSGPSQSRDVLTHTHTHTLGTYRVCIAAGACRRQPLKILNAPAKTDAMLLSLVLVVILEPADSAPVSSEPHHRWWRLIIGPIHRSVLAREKSSTICASATPSTLSFGGRAPSSNTTHSVPAADALQVNG